MLSKKSLIADLVLMRIEDLTAEMVLIYTKGLEGVYARFLQALVTEIRLVKNFSHGSNSNATSDQSSWWCRPLSTDSRQQQAARFFCTTTTPNAIGGPGFGFLTSPAPVRLRASGPVQSGGKM